MRGEVRLGEWLTRIEAGKSPAAEDTPAGEGEWGVLKVSAVQPDGFAARENKVIRDMALVHPRYEVRHGDLLVTRANTEELVGLACVADMPPPRLLLSDKTLRLHVDGTRADRKFVQLVLARSESRHCVRALATGTSAGMKNIGQEQIRQLPVPDVPLEEQRGIVAAHAAFDRRIGALDEVRSKLRVAARAALAINLQGVPRVEYKPLKDVLQRVETGWSPVCESRTPAEDEWGVLKLSAVTSGSYDESEAKALPLQTPPRTGLEVRPGDVLMSRANGVKALVGVACAVEQTRPCLMLPDLMFRLLADPDLLDQRFLGLVLSSDPVRRQIDDAMRGSSGQYKISKADVQSLQVPCMPPEGQRRVVAVHAEFMQRIDVLSRQIGKLRTLQQAVVEDLFAGRGRVRPAAA
ncbi:hypothetical protein [Streptomyces bluensis]|uniref:hypothetical protein n=1 Tax=Streptomyces bluensis TaxID=33897 RepID=UPI0016759CE0|nr:hypothetical protein [Streptomyces bluensis]GGZ66005.1 hypothetical protein GCM10010344_35580 [Streptomyces bluensis]